MDKMVHRAIKLDWVAGSSAIGPAGQQVQRYWVRRSSQTQCSGFGCPARLVVFGLAAQPDSTIIFD